MDLSKKLNDLKTQGKSSWEEQKDVKILICVI